MSNQHTPGPWELGNAVGAGRNYAVCAGPLVVARISGNGYPIGSGSDPTSDANARLISAAPDLLAVAERAASYFRDTDSPLGVAARKAIAKATGA